MASKLLVSLEKELTCPICQQFLREPLSLDCGHSFCKSCITAHNNEAVTGPGGESSCPVCGIRYLLGEVWANQHLSVIVERLRKMKSSPKEEQKKEFCVHHGQKCLLFCKEDGKPICWLCEQSQEHHGHPTFLMEEVIKKSQVKLHEALTRLRKEQQEAEKLQAGIREDRASWKYQVQTERQRIQAEFNHLRGVLDSEELRELQKLEEEERKVLDNLAEAEEELVQQSQLVRELISDLERRNQWSPVELLQDMSGIMKWCEIWTLKKPKTLPKKLKCVFRAPDLSRMLQVFKELTDAQRYWVDVTMNPVNLNLSLVLSEDQRQVMSVPIWPVKCYNYEILGSQYFSSGKHYWEVDVSEKTAWILGVYCRTLPHNMKFDVKARTNHQNVYSRYRPQYGYWVIGLQNQFQYNAFEDSSPSDPQVLTLSMPVPPRRVGIFLDFEAGAVSFFNVTNHGFLIYKFFKCCFSQKTFPYFNPWNCPAPLTLCPPSS